MGVLFDAGSSGYVGYGGTIVMAHVVGAASDRLLVVGVEVQSLSDKVASVTYGGVALTRERADFGVTPPTYMYSLLNPPSGTANIVITFTSADVGATADGASFSGVHQTTPISAKAGLGTPDAASPNSINISVQSGGMAVSMIGSGPVGPFTPGSGQTQVAQQNNSPADGGSTIGAMSYKANATSMSWSWSTGQKHVSQTVLAIAPAATSGGGGDTTAPTLTGSITASSITQTGFTLAWPAGADNVAVTGYEYSLNGGASYIDAGTALGKVVGGLTAATAYQVRVRSYDAAGNKSTPLSATVTTSSSSGSTPVATITTGAYQNNTGTVLANLTGLTVAVLDLSTLATVAVFTGKGTSSTGVLTLTDTAIVAGTEYAVVTKNAAKTLGIEKYTAA